jgi:hypothetical protein
MSLAGLDALAGVKVRCEVIERHGCQGLLNGVDIGRRWISVGVGVPAVLEGLVDAENEPRQGQAGASWRGTLVKPWEWRASSSPRASTPSAPVGTLEAAAPGFRDGRDGALRALWEGERISIRA